jgi:predicted amidohydrolase
MFETAEDRARPLNTLALGHDGGLTAYRKIHLYDSFGYHESRTISPGPVEPTVVDLHGFPVGLMTCYDLRFPELTRSLAEQGAEAVVVPAAWVAGNRKVEHWRTLLRARAIENTVWMVGVGQPGPRYTGHSLVVAPDGDVVVEAGEDEAVLDAVLDREAVAAVRRTNPSLANRRM